MRLRPALLAALPLLFAVAPVAAHATGVPFLGPIVNLPTDNNGVQCAANWNALIQIANNLVAFSITILLLFVTPTMIVWAGFLYVFSPTNPAMRKQANTILKDTAIGIGFALAAWLIVDLLLTSLDTVTLSGAKGGVQSFTAELFSTSGSGPCLRVAVSGNFNSSNPTVSSGTASNGVALLTGAQACGGADKVDNASEPNTSGPAVVCSDGSTKCLYPNADPVNGCALPPGVSIIGYHGINGGNYGVSGTQCASDNTACGVPALQAMGMTSSQANVMACIAVTESSGNPNTPPYNSTHPGSNSSACGTFQITQTTWNNYASGDCSDFSNCMNANCNAQVAAALVASHGYSDWTCPGCNSKAAGCVQQYGN